MHTTLRVVFFFIVCSFQFRIYPIIYLLSGRPGMGDSSYRKCFCDCRPKAKPGAEGRRLAKRGVHVLEGETAPPHSKITQV